MDRIVKHLLNDFLATQEMEPSEVSEDFENFVNFSIISNEYNKVLELANITVGTGDDTGIDGLAIIINGQLINSAEEIDFLLENNNYIEATYLFLQAKTSPKFESSEMNNFAFGVKDFFAEEPKLRRNRDIQYLAEISEYLFSKAPYFRENPVCKLFYVTNGIWDENDQNLNAIKESAKNDLLATNLFSKVEFKAYGANEIARIYRQTKNSIQATFNFANKVLLPELPGITEAYFGMLPLSEYKKLLVDDNGNLRNIFYDNVRDFQGFRNPINTKIASTLEGEEPDLFAVLNNGITIVANSVRPSRNTFTITDYQVVNGCQTSNVLFNYINNKDLSSLSVPLKLIVTTNDDVKNRITVATNSQTAIKREQLQAMTDFQKMLEEFYKTTTGEGELYYERRSGQYQTDNSVIKARVITIQTQIKSFSSMFLENPHRVTSYFGTVVKQNIEIDEPRIFNPKHQHIPYYLSGLAYYRLDSLFRSRAIDTKYRKIKFYFLMLFRMLAEETNFSNKHLRSQRLMKKYCSPMINTLLDKDKSLDVFNKAIVIWELSKMDIEDKQLLKQAKVTENLKEVYRKFDI